MMLALKRFILNKLQKRINLKNQKRLTCKNISIISNNCLGGFISHYLGLQFCSPTVNLFIRPSDFISMLKSFDDYFNSELEIEEVKGIADYPIGKCGGGYLLHFMHYNTFDEAVAKWRERCSRIDKDALYIMMTDRDGCTYQDLQEFDRLPYKNKVVFTHCIYSEIKSSYYIHGFENEPCVGQLQESMNILGKRYIDQFDYVDFFNKGNDNGNV